MGNVGNFISENWHLILAVAFIVFLVVRGFSTNGNANGGTQQGVTPQQPTQPTQPTQTPVQNTTPVQPTMPSNNPTQYNNQNPPYGR